MLDCFIDLDLIPDIETKLVYIKTPCRTYPPIIRIKALAGFENVVIKEITSGGPGSSDGCCCGVTLGVHGPSGDGAGYVYAKTEDWGHLGGKKHGYAKYLCDDSGHNGVGPCNNPPQRANVSGKTVHLMWQVQNVNGGAKYIGSVNGVPIDNPVLFNPTSFDGKPILPGIPNEPCRKHPNDPTRVRVDGAGTNVTFNSGHGLKVTPLSSYQSGKLKNIY